MPVSPRRFFPSLALALLLTGCASLPGMAQTPNVTISAPNVFSGKTVLVSSNFNDTFPAAALTDGKATGNPFCFGEGALHDPEKIAVTGFVVPKGQALTTLRFFDGGYFREGPTASHVVVYYSSADIAAGLDALATGRYKRLYGYGLNYAPTEEKDSFGKTLRMAILTGLAIPPGTRSLLLDFADPNRSGGGSGEAFSEIQGFLTPGPTPTAPPTLGNLGKIMPLGDSITQGNYREHLYTDLHNANAAFQFVGSWSFNPGFLANVTPDETAHEGHGGYRIGDLESNLDGLNDNTTGYPHSTNSGGFWFPGIADGPNKRPALYPDIILLHAGTNDISQGHTPEACRDSLRALIQRIVTDRPQAQLIVATLIPRSGNAASEARNQAFNALIPALLAEPQFRGKHITFVDMHSKLTAADIGDGVHPTEAGYAKMADAWFEAIRRLPMSRIAPRPQ